MVMVYMILNTIHQILLATTAGHNNCIKYRGSTTGVLHVYSTVCGAYSFWLVIELMSITGY